jgi:predicted  nucleic acid-binding Zn-ribbon protein
MHAREALASLSVEDGQHAKTSIEAVSKVLPKSNTFLRNVGIQQPATKTTNVMKELQAELDAKKLQSARLEQELERLKAHTQESDAKVDKQAEEIESLRKMAADTQSLLRQMIAFGQGQISPP